MGYVHRDLKPENVVLNLEPLEVKVIDLERARLDSQSSKGTALATPGYMPEVSCWADGSRKWDMWALAAMICEADMAKDAYLHVNREE